MFCKQCGKPVDDGQELCSECQNVSNTETTQNVDMNTQSTTSESAQKSKMIAGLLGVLLGSLGIHNFYLGYTVKGIIQLLMTVLSFLTCGITAIAAGVWGLIEGILIFTGSISVDAKGNPIKD